MAIIGIDLGTTNSAATVWRDDRIEQIPNRLGEHLTPSVIGIDNDDKIIVGAVAKERLVADPSKTVSVFKRLVGTEHKVQIGNKKFTTAELSSLVIKSLVEDAEQFLGEKVDQAVISVPAYFNENQRAATKLAGELAGITVKRLINEPTAAAMAYGLNERQQGTFMILDMGGGTFDVSILEYFEGVMEVHASAGDNYLGGEDIVEAMVISVLNELNLQKSDFKDNQEHQLYMQMETIKKRIDQIDRETIDVNIADKVYQWTITESWFRQLITPFLLKAKRPIQQALQDSQMNASDIDDLILVGGATRLKQFKTLIAKLFGRLPNSNIDPDRVVSIGAGVQAGLIAKNKALDDIVLTDVCPYTLGTAIQDEQAGLIFMPIIERNSVVPISVERTLVTVQDGQDEMNIQIFQGENRDISKNVFLGFLNIKVPKSKAGQEAVNIRYSYDMNGLLEVDAMSLSTNKVVSKVIENAPGALSKKDIEAAKERLAKLKFHPRDDEVNKKLIAKAERIYATSIGQKREEIGYILGQFQAVLHNQKPIEIAKAQESFLSIIEQFDQEEWT